MLLCTICLSGCQGNHPRLCDQLDEDKGSKNGEDGPFTKTLKEYGVEGGQVVAPVVGTFAEIRTQTKQAE
jgi:hypothetical protein